MSDVATADAPAWPPAAPEPARAGLHQPWRALIALVELVLAGVAVWGAFALWQGGISDVVVRLADGATLTSRHYAGDHLAGAIGLGLVAALLVLDAVRQVLLAVRAGRKGKRRKR